MQINKYDLLNFFAHYVTSSVENCIASNILNWFLFLSFEISMAVTVKVADFWNVAPCSLYRRFSGSCCLHHQGRFITDNGGRRIT
jgi:Ca2+/Na+ antiporter